MKAEYQLLPQASSEGPEEPDTRIRSVRCRKHFYSGLLNASVIVLVATNVLTIALLFGLSKRSSGSLPPSDYARVDDLAVVWKRFWWETPYSSSNRTQNDALWDRILPSHGIVAVRKDHAEAMHWPRSLTFPGDSSKMTYLLEAYHQIHCLQIIRKTFWEAVDKKPFTYHPSQHAEHCFDMLRQSVQCYADNTPLWSFGKFTAGDGQVHRCRDWGQLKNWATEHTACYRDSVEGIPLKDHFGFCDEGLDGLEKTDEGRG